MLQYWWEVFLEGLWSSAEAIGYSRQTLAFLVLFSVIGAGYMRWTGAGWQTVKDNIVKTLLEAAVIGLVAWIPFLLFHVARASYSRWNEAVVAKEDAEKKLREAAADTPRFSIMLNQLFSAHAGQDRRNSMVIVGGAITNLGTPGSVQDFKIDVRLAGNTVAGQFPAVPSPQQRFAIGHTPGGHAMYLSGSDHWAITARKIIPKYDHADGWITAVIPGITEEQLHAARATVVLSCTDATGKTYTAEKQFSDAPSSTLNIFSIEEIQPPENR